MEEAARALIRSPRTRPALLLGLALALYLAPFAVGTEYRLFIATQMAAYVLVAVGVNLLNGYGGRRLAGAHQDDGLRHQRGDGGTRGRAVRGPEDGGHARRFHRRLLDLLPADGGVGRRRTAVGAGGRCDRVLPGTRAADRAA